MAHPKQWTPADADALFLPVLIANAKKEGGTKLTTSQGQVAVEDLGESPYKIDYTRPFWVILKDDKEDFSFMEVIFFDGRSMKSVMRSDLMEVSDLTNNIVATVNDLNSDFKLDKQWDLKDLISEAAKDEGYSESSLGEFEQAIVIGFTPPFNKIDFIPFGNWDVAPESLEPPIEIVEEEWDHDDSDNPYTYESKKKSWEDYNPWMRKDYDHPSEIERSHYK